MYFGMLSYMSRTFHVFWYVDLYMDRTVHILFVIWIVYEQYGSFSIWEMGNIWTHGFRVGGPAGGDALI